MGLKELLRRLLGLQTASTNSADLGRLLESRPPKDELLRYGTLDGMFEAYNVEIKEAHLSEEVQCLLRTALSHAREGNKEYGGYLSQFHNLRGYVTSHKIEVPQRLIDNVHLVYEAGKAETLPSIIKNHLEQAALLRRQPITLDSPEHVVRHYVEWHREVATYYERELKR